MVGIVKIIIMMIIDGEVLPEITRKILTKAVVVALASQTQVVTITRIKKVVVVVTKIIKTQAVKRIITRKKGKIISRERNHHHLLVIVIPLLVMMVHLVMIHYRMIHILIGKVMTKMKILIQMVLDVGEECL